jgi:hypothetical protein
MKTFTAPKVMCRRIAHALSGLFTLLLFSHTLQAQDVTPTPTPPQLVAPTPTPAPPCDMLSTSCTTVSYSQTYPNPPGAVPVQNNTGTALGAPDCTVQNSCSTFDLTIDPSVGTAASGYDPTQYQIYMQWNWKNDPVPGATPPVPGQVPTGYDIYVVERTTRKVIASDTSTAQPATIVLPATTAPVHYDVIAVPTNGPATATQPDPDTGLPVPVGIGYTGTIDLDLIGLPLVSGNGADLLPWTTCGLLEEETIFENLEQEPSIAINPTDPNNLVVGWTEGRADGIGVAYSMDGGQSWTHKDAQGNTVPNVVVPPTNFCTGGTEYLSAHNPWVSFGLLSNPDNPDAPQGVAYLSSFVNGIAGDPTGETTATAGAIIVNRSTGSADEPVGKSWSSPAVLARAPGPCSVDPADSCDFVDDSNVLADPSRQGFAYAAWTAGKVLTTGKAAGNQYVSQTRDGGQNWSAPSRIPSDPDPNQIFDQGVGRLVILPNGTLVDVFLEVPPFDPTSGIINPGSSPATGPTKVMAARSTDGGLTWPDPPVTIAIADPSLSYFVLAGVASAPDGTIYVAWPRGDSSGSSFSLMYSKSTDGVNWADAARIGEPIRGPIVIFAPSLAVAPDGTLGVAFYDHRYDSASNSCGSGCLVTDFWFRHSPDGGQTWAEEHLSGPFRGFSFSNVGSAIAPLPDGFATAFPLGRKIANSSGQHLSHPPTDIFYSKVSLGVKLAGVVSRKVHGDAGTFDIDLPRTGTPGIECRSGGASGDYTLVFTFANDNDNELASVGGVSVTGGAATIPTVVSSAIDTSNPNQYIVNLTGVSDAQYVTVTLNNVTDSLGKFSTAVSATMGVLLGDVNGSKRTDNGDAIVIRNLSGTIPTAQDTTSIRADVNLSGRVDNGDAIVVRNNSGAVLP